MTLPDAPTLRRLLAPIFLSMVVLLLVTAVLGTLSAVLSYRVVTDLATDLNPAVRANSAAMQSLTDAESQVRSWSLGGERSAITAYEAAWSRYIDELAALRQHVGDDSELAALVQRFSRAAKRWQADYGEVRIHLPGGASEFRPDLFRVGNERFARVRALHDEIGERLDERAEDAQDVAVKRLRRTAVAMGISALLAAWVAIVARGRVNRDLRDPLADLVGAVRRQASGDLGARAELVGPQELQLVATALNELADASDRARAAEAAVAEEVRALDTARGDFVSNVSHELRTPLTTLSGYLELVEDEFEGRLTERHQTMLEAGRRNIDRLRALIEDLLTLSRVENPGTDLEQIDLATLVRDAVDDQRLTASRRGIRLVYAAPEEPLSVLADRGQLYRVFQNLLTNAVKFSRDGTEVRIDVEQQDADAVIRVVDHGMGIPAADLRHVGTRFFRASNAMQAQVPGTGLGLRIVQAIVANHGGHLRLDSIEGQGTTATVTLPRHGVDDESPEQTVPAAG